MAVLLTKSEIEDFEEKGVEVIIGEVREKVVRYKSPKTQTALVAYSEEGLTTSEFGRSYAQYLTYDVYMHGGQTASYILRAGKGFGNTGDRCFIEIRRRLMLRRVRRALGI